MLIPQSQDKELKLVSCLAHDVNLLANQCRYWYKAAYINGLC